MTPPGQFLLKQPLPPFYFLSNSPPFLSTPLPITFQRRISGLWMSPRYTREHGSPSLFLQSSSLLFSFPRFVACSSDSKNTQTPIPLLITSLRQLTSLAAVAAAAEEARA
mmetsp:Transcript_52039/g.89372  ORF Transcript_52039/g.89372 Transcript_52039/m.89372 type:complete len:110 (+) Transcript_52039:100-429(+)